MKTCFKPIAVISALFCAASLNFARGGEEASVLVEKKAEVAVTTPKLVPPANNANTQLLPPPSNPNLVVQPVAPSPSTIGPKQPFMRPAEPRRRVPATTALSIKEEPMPAPESELLLESPVIESSGIEVHPAPPIEYDTDSDARRMYRKSGEVQVMMIAQNPADGCYYEIPMCIPACCVGEPKVSGGRGLLGRGVVEFCWECGFRAEVKFRHILGDVKVEYEGD